MTTLSEMGEVGNNRVARKIPSTSSELVQANRCKFFSPHRNDDQEAKELRKRITQFLGCRPDPPKFLNCVNAIPRIFLGWLPYASGGAFPQQPLVFAPSKECLGVGQIAIGSYWRSLPVRGNGLKDVFLCDLADIGPPVFGSRPLWPSIARLVAAPRRRLETCFVSYSSRTSLRQRPARSTWRAIAAAFFRAWFGSAPSRISCRRFWAVTRASGMSIAGHEPNFILVRFPLCSRQFSTQFAERFPARCAAPALDCR